MKETTRLSMATKVPPGDYYISVGNELLVATVGTSCGIFLHDPKSRVCGLLHFMLPPDTDAAGKKDFAETVIRDLLLVGFTRAGGRPVCWRLSREA